MLASLNSKQIVDEIVKDTVKDNDPHDVLDIAPEIVLASRPDKGAPTLVPDSAARPEPKINLVTEAPAAAPSVDTAVRAAAGDLHIRRKRSSVGRWFSGAFVTLLFAGGSAAATIAWQTHGDTAKAIVAAWMPTLVAAPSQATPPVTEQASPSTEQQGTAADQPAEQPAIPTQAQDNSNTSPPTAPDSAQSLQSMTRDLAAMTQQIAQLKANIAELKASQEQMAREIAKAATPKPAEARIADPRVKLSALPPRPPAPPVRKPRPVAATPAYSPTYAPAPIAPPPQAAVVPPPPPPASTSQLADDDGPVVRPPMPVH
ncbi:hypothetical protein [Bradyrhizobium iriomotense]|uniref:Uncharacterized protein n=1 Tax=Bradyrhizobium iriomotense TaxID=441950 RepID=A0ABQ6B9A5_9BRAD|nr:hypothetical protein [Bradyrhizobium iriomotense]GLR90446.1 hypothetical protein GCM10007857_71610 [Bradyrhizobium iriomotense]